MGVKDLNKLIARHAPAAVRACQLSDFAGKTFAIDAYGLLFSYKVVGGTPSGYLGLLYDLCRKFRREKIDAVFVMDGETLPQKHAARAVRQKRKVSATNRLAERQQELGQVQKAHEKFVETIDKTNLPSITPEQQQQLDDLTAEMKMQEERVVSVEKQLVAITPEDVEAVTALFQAFGFGVAISKHEGEAGCVQLVERGAADFVVSNDTDVMCFGDVRVIQNLSQPISMRVVDTERVRDIMGLSRTEFVDMCILCGCDFSSKLKKLASLGAYKAIQEYRSIELVVSSCPQFERPTDGSWTPEDARYVFLTMPCPVDVLPSNRDLDRLAELFEKHQVSRTLSSEDVKQIDQGVAERKISFNQPNIFEYFKSKPTSPKPILDETQASQ